MTTTINALRAGNDALRRVVTVAIRRDRRGYKKAAKLQKNSWHYYSLIEGPKQKIQGLML